MTNQKMPLNRSLLWILLSILFIPGSIFMGWLYFLHIKERRIHDDQYKIVSIIQSTPQSDSLKTVYLAEILDLSFDRPINLYQFNIKEARLKLLSNFLIKEASIKKILPGTLFIQYKIRMPIAYLGDFSNTMIDEEGFIFPARPFFTPKNLATIYLGLDIEECKWGDCLKEKEEFKLAYSVLNEFEKYQLENFQIKQLDLMHVQADSYGQRQIVLVLENCSNKSSENKNLNRFLIFLRLNPDSYQQNLANVQILKFHIFEKHKQFIQLGQKKEAMIIDLRIPHLAFIK